MLRTVLVGALAAGALAGGGAAQAHEYGYAGGYDAGTPAYAREGYGPAPYHRSNFTLVGARAGVTVLGIDLDASAKLTIGAHGWGGGHAAPPPPPQPMYAPEPEYGPPPMSYGPPAPPPEPRHWMGYSHYGYGCGC